MGSERERRTRIIIIALSLSPLYTVIFINQRYIYARTRDAIYSLRIQLSLSFLYLSCALLRAEGKREELQLPLFRYALSHTHTHTCINIICLCVCISEIFDIRMCELCSCIQAELRSTFCLSLFGAINQPGSFESCGEGTYNTHNTYNNHHHHHPARTTHIQERLSRLYTLLCMCICALFSIQRVTGMCIISQYSAGILSLSPIQGTDLRVISQHCVYYGVAHRVYIYKPVK